MNEKILFLLILLSSKLFSYYKLETVIDNLDYPWGLAFISENTILVTELPGKIKKIDLEKGEIIEINNIPKFYLEGKEVVRLILHPDYADNGWIYISYSALLDDGQNTLL